LPTAETNLCGFATQTKQVHIPDSEFVHKYDYELIYQLNAIFIV